MSAALRVEWRKLTAQPAVRAIALVCLLAPLLFAFVLDRQGGVPGDSLLGIWVHESGFADSFVLLGFGGYLGFPVLAAVASGDLFSSEDRHGTWKTLLTRSRPRGEVFAAKVLAGFGLTAGLGACLMVSSLLGGLLFAGAGDVVGLSGNSLSGGEAVGLLLLSWLLELPALLAFASLAMLLSLVSRSGIAGVLGTAAAGLAMQLLGYLASGSWLHALLLSSAFDAWHGLLADPGFYAPAAIAIAVSLLWGAAALAAAWALMRRRQFAGATADTAARRSAAIRAVGGLAVLVAVLAALSGLGPKSVTRARLEGSISTAFERLTLLQQRELGRSLPAGTKLELRTRCLRRGGAASGPGDDWSCTITLVTPQAGATPVKLTPVTYDVSVRSNGCYKADAPPAFIGNQTMRTPAGASVVNPLFTIYGCFDTTGTASGCPRGRCAGQAPQPHTSAPSPGSSRRSTEQQTREAERSAGQGLITEQEESERYFERKGREAAGSGGR